MAEKAFGLKPESIRVAEFVTGWGSCGASGPVQIDWRLNIAPRGVVEHFVVHELAHLKHWSHGEVFWGYLASILPYYELDKGWLDAHQGGLDGDFLRAAPSQSPQ